ncbi:hypothetical protein ASPWEDRAFT_143976 [Aspergillus wentii DTO 134E9]|uniref:Cyanovirin-N domain-containing protein n=1 Tax=Aspergillus wentii DTO 134E9 TaxID=1073089 RepID=A0A1L9R4X0_ASPWE|nr:uncharacterized protein ASPWEDRAFT_143976 [Aspergillus wentii DTO 134E9]KAI9927209.1 hypothetical protein MW887_003593 [Aspergillus wentii]OJJ29933.1 hypothetical protein ASPWEDRAFT_143976 [Aspergillus wentii DTO 134E9]
MGFAETSRNIRIEQQNGSTWLYAESETRSGEWVDSSINLDEVIGNDDGWFSRDTNNFTASAQDIHLEERDDGPWLVAELPTRDQGSRGSQGINLNLHIDNINGELEWIPE